MLLGISHAPPPPSPGGRGPSVPKNFGAPTYDHTVLSTCGGGRVSRGQPLPISKAREAPQPENGIYTTYAHTVGQTATELCMVIKLD